MKPHAKCGDETLMPQCLVRLSIQQAGREGFPQARHSSGRQRPLKSILNTPSSCSTALTPKQIP